MFRQFVERISRGVIFKRQLPSRFGGVAIYVSPDAQLKYLWPGEKGFDETLFALVDRWINSQSIVWDIGANVGVFTFAAAGIAREGSVTAVEPDAWLASLLARSQQLRRNSGLNVQILSCAIAGKNGVEKFLIAQRGRASNALAAAGGRSQMGGVRHTEIVPSLTLDTLLEYFSWPTFVKIDVEGAEVIVLNGARKLLETVRPVLYIEVGDKQLKGVTAILRAAGYKMYDGDESAGTGESLDECVTNTLAVPE